ncbi:MULTISPECIES: hypothetical protein [unclassified Salinivibrio]|uniref:hypothetical protein n=1 Tax=unclassified Salinivibrio TaxID=2636825 RepID=UPI0009857E35|nr:MULTISPECIES: hypothetical protein [unclassified Salinivibrio]OOF11139.1 hypothetical protein BZG83_12960 [Salinivibrio sp. PR919]OOF13867.1 hypothetical protein BZG84_15205 [Salinivibrio sp. PR932]
MDDNARQLLNHLCHGYDQLAQRHQTRAFPELSTAIKHPLGYCLVHCPIGSQRLSIVSLQFAPSVRGQGVLTAFIDYIQAHPHHYRGIEVATIQNQSLAKRLLTLGWRYKSALTKLFRANTPTLVHDF